MKAVYQAPTEEAAMTAFDTLDEKWRKQYPLAVSVWERNWDRISAMYQFTPEIRRLIYTTNPIAGQMVRCGTSPAPNYEEACAAESPRDFVHKLAIVLKELRESRVWIRLIVKAKLLGAEKMTDLEDEATQLCKKQRTPSAYRNIIAKSIVTAKQNANIR